MAKDQRMIASANKDLRDWIRLAWANAADGLTWREAVRIAMQLADRAYDYAAMWLSVPGPDKKKWVLDQVRQLLEGLAPLLPLPLIFKPFRKWLVPPFIEFVVQLASVLVELIYNRVKKRQIVG